MSLQDTLKQIRRQLAEWIKQQQRLRRRKLNVVRLEDRRLPDATFALIGDALTLNGFDGATDSIDISFDSSTSTLNLTLNSGNWLDGTGGPLDPALNVAGSLLSVDVSSLVSGSLSLLQIDGGAGLKNVTDSGQEFSIQSLVVSGESDVVLDASNDFDSIRIEAKSLSLTDSDDLQIAGLDVTASVDITAMGHLNSSALAQLAVGGNLSVSGSSILLTETNEFGSLTFQSTGDVTIFENGSMLLTGVSSADSIELHATNHLSDDSAAELSVDNHAKFSAESITITGSFEAGSLSFHATDTVEIHEVDGMQVSEASEASGRLQLTAGDSLQIDGTLDVDGDVTLESGNGGDILLNAKLMSTGVVQISSDGGIEVHDDLDPVTVTLQSNDDVIVNASVVASDQITIEAGLDGSGSFELQAGGSLMVDSVSNTAGIVISTGTTAGNVSIAGSITADGLTEITTSESINGAGLLRSADLALRAATGMGSAGTLNTQVSNLSFRNTTSGNVAISNTGALSIAGAGSVDGTGGNELGNFGAGSTTIAAASPLTIATDVTSVGSMILTAGETSDAPGFMDDLQVNSGVTVSVSGAGATLTLRAGDDVIVQGRASASTGNLIVDAGFSDLDGEGSIHFDGQLVAGQQADLNAITGINDDVAGNIKATSLNVRGGNTATLDNGHDVLNIAANFAGSLTFRNSTSFNVSTVGATSGISLTQPGAALNLTASAGTIGFSADLTSLGNQTFHSAVELKSNATVDSGSGDVLFASTLNSAAGQALGVVVNSSGQTSFQDAVGTGANQELGFLTTNATGSTNLSDDVETIGEQSYGDGVTLTGNVTLSAADTDADGEGVDFGSTLTGGSNNLTVVGGAGFAASVTGVGSLSADHIDSESTINASTVTVSGTADLGGNVTTTGEQVYSGAVLLTNDVTLSAADTDADGEGVDFGATLTGGSNDLTVVGGVGFAASVTGVGSLSVDHIDSESTINASTVTVSGTADLGGDVTTTGMQDYSGPVLLTADVEVTSTLNGQVRFGDTVDGAHNLTVDTGGTTSFLGNIGGTNRLRTLTTDGAGQTVIDLANIDVDTLILNDAVVLNRDVQVDATTSAAFGNTITGNTGAESLTITSGTVTIDGAVSQLQNLEISATQTTLNGNLSLAGLVKTDAAGTTKLNMGTILAADVQFNDAVELCQDISITAENILFAKTIDEATAATGSELSLTISNPGAATGDVVVNQAIGSVRSLESLTITAANDVSLLGTIETTGSVIQNSGTGTTTLNGTGPSSIGGQLSLTSDNVTFDTSDITTVGAISIVAANQILLNANAGLSAGSSTISLRANEDGTGNEGLIQQNGSVIRTTNATTNAIEIEAAGTGSASIGDVRATGRVAISAGGSIVDNSTAETANITADAVVLQARSGIGTAGTGDINTNVASLEALSVTGGIVIAEVSDITIGGVTGTLSGLDASTSGDIQLTANGSITVTEGVNGSDDISLTAVGATSDIRVASGSGVTSVDGVVILSADQTVTVSADVNTGASGTLTITGNANAGARNAIIDQGAVVSVVNGHLMIDADQGVQQTGNFEGVRIDGAEVRTDGSGEIVIDGRGGNSVTGSQAGVLVTNSGLVRSTSTLANPGNIQIHGLGGTNAGNDNAGIAILAGGQSTTVNGDLQLTGIGGSGAGHRNHGVVIDAGTVSTTGSSATDVGDVRVVGTKGIGANSNAIVMSNLAILSVTNPNAANGATLTLESLPGDVTESSGATITANNLELLGDGNFSLAESNQIETLAADIDGTLDVRNASALVVGTAGLTSGVQSNNGSVHVRTDTGSITINRGIDTTGISANGTGDVRLEAIGPNSDVTLNASIISGSGAVVIISDRDVVQNNDGDIQTSSADVLINAERNWTMAVDAEIESSNGAIGGLTHTGEMAIGRLTATTVMLNSAKSVSDSNGIRLNVIATELGIVASESIGDSNNAGTTPSAIADAIDTNVTTLAASSHHGVFINELNSLVIGSTASTTIGGTTFSAVSGVNSDNSDVFLNVGQNLTLNQSVNAGTADLRIVANGNVTQSANGTIIADEFGLQQRSTTAGHVTLQSNNDINVIAASNAVDGGDLLFSDVDNLIIRNVTAQSVGRLSFSSTTGLAATGGDIQVLAQGDITILRSITSRNGVVDNTSASGETIRIESVDGNIVIDATSGPVLISTDEGPGSHASTGDQVTLLADSDKSYNGDLDGDLILDANDTDTDGDGIANTLDSLVDGTPEGKVTMLGDVTISSDGGVAKKFGPRPAVGESSTAFFVFSSNPLPVVIDNSPAFWNGANAYVDAFGVEIGVSGEENLTVDIDWRDPANEAGILLDPGMQLLAQSLGIDNPVSSQRFQQFLIANGGQMNEIGHVYTTADMTLFQKVLNITTIVIDLSVSHHASLSISGAFIEQAGTGQSVPGLDVTSTDNPTNGFGNFDNGVATFKIPTVTPAPPALFAAEASNRIDRPMTVAPPENTAVFASLVVGDFSGGAVSGSAFSTEVYFQIRRQFEVNGPTEVVVERITDSRLISSREALEKFVDQHPELQDGAGYEIWLISETGGQKVERPVVEFEITGGKPGPASEAEQNSAEPPKLIDLPFEQPAETEDVQPKAELPGTTSAKPMLPVFDPAVPDADSEALDADENDTVSQVMPVDAIDEDMVASAAMADDNDESNTGLSDSPNGRSLGAYLLAVGTVAGISVNRFRQRQQTSEEPNRYSRAARFRRHHDGS